VSYLEGCTAPAFDTNQLHAAVVELIVWIALKLNMQPYKIGMQEIKRQARGIYNFVTKKRGAKVIAQKSPGLRWKWELRSLGNIRLYLARG